MQLRLRDYLGQKFNEMKKTPNDVFKNPRALAKLFKEAGRLKTVLSANPDHFAQVISNINLFILMFRKLIAIFNIFSILVSKITNILNI